MSDDVLRALAANLLRHYVSPASPVAAAAESLVAAAPIDRGLDAGKPVIGATAEQLQSVKVPVIIVPGNDRTHDKGVGERAHAIMKGSEIYHLFPDYQDIDIVPPQQWEVKDDELAGVFAGFMKRNGA